MLSVKDYILFHDLDTVYGTGGGPIWLESGNNLILVGIHVARGSDERGKRAALVTKDTIDSIIPSIIP